MASRGRRGFAFLYSNVIGRLGERDFGPYRSRLLAHVGPITLEIGAGNGLNLAHYPAGVLRQLALTEPDPHMFKRLRKRALAENRLPVEVVRTPARNLPADDGSVDTVVATLVLCTVPDVAASLSEIRRVLRPGGRFLFIEHVRSPDPAFAAKQDRADRWFGTIAGGCHPNRATETAMRAAGFDIAEGMETFELKGSWLTKPLIMGMATPTS